MRRPGIWQRLDRRERPILLLNDPRHPAALVARPCRFVDRLLAQACAAGLDRRLADGEAPESDRLLAARAHMLVSAHYRREVAHDWERVLSRLELPPSPRTPSLGPRRELAESEPAARAMLVRLAAETPVAARGVATARLLLVDAAGPLYNRRHPTDLREILRKVSAQLDPFASLLAG